jgi:hypothetical protein
MSIIELTKESINDSLYISLNEFTFKVIDSQNGLWLSIGPFYTIKDGDYYPGLFNKVNKNSYMLNTTTVDQWIDIILESSDTNELTVITEFKNNKKLKEYHEKFIEKYIDKIKKGYYEFNSITTDNYKITRQVFIN